MIAMENNYTTFQEMYDFFLSGITDDMFMELTVEDTKEMLFEIMIGALPHFEFPRKNISDLNLQDKCFMCKLTLEEMSIIRAYMIVEWIGYQLASIENIRQKYSGSDFAFTSQANHIGQLISLSEKYKEKGYHLQRLYGRRRMTEKGTYRPLFGDIMDG